MPGNDHQERPATTARKQSILDAALACFVELGVDGTTVSDIQGRAECSVGSLYHHFGSKEGVAEALFIAGIADFNAHMLRRLRRCADGEQSVKTVVFAYCDWVLKHSDMARYLHSRDISFSPEAKVQLKEMRHAYISEVFAWFTPFVSRGEVRVLPADAYIPLISGPIQEYVRRWLAGDASSPRRVRNLFADAAWSAVKGTPAES